MGQRVGEELQVWKSLLALSDRSKNIVDKYLQFTFFCGSRQGGIAGGNGESNIIFSIKFCAFN